MTRKYVRNVPEPVVTFERVEPEPIWFHYGIVCERLTGFYAGLYRGMIWMYGSEKEAAARFWGLFHQNKSGAISPENAAPTLNQGI